MNYDEIQEQFRSSEQRVKDAQAEHNNILRLAQESGDINKNPQLLEEARALYHRETQIILVGDALARTEDSWSNINTNNKPLTGEQKKLKDKMDGLLIEKDWEEAARQYNTLFHNGRTFYNGIRAHGDITEMKKFDSEQFELRVQVNDNIWSDLVRVPNSAENYLYLLALNNLKTLNPENYRERLLRVLNEKIKKGILLKILRQITEFENEPANFLPHSAVLKDFNPQAFQLLIGQNVHYQEKIWPEVIKFVDSQRYNVVRYLEYASRAQKIKPDGQPDFGLDSAMKRELTLALNKRLKRGLYNDFFGLANQALSLN